MSSSDFNADDQFPRRFGKYLLLSRLGRGGMAEVYLAKLSGMESFQRLIAIKCMRPEVAEDDSFANMFIDEASLAGQLTHANIAQTYELGRFAGRLYIAMELVEGRDLRDIQRESDEHNEPLSLAMSAYICSKVAEGLAYAHRQVSLDGQPLNLVHRDISPQNILVSFQGEVKIIDFGIARAGQRATETMGGVLKGNVNYMSPEQVRGESIDGRSDIFSLGLVLYELIKGRKLIEGDSDFRILERLAHGFLPDIRAELPDAPPELISVLLRSLAFDRNQRFPTAVHMAKALEPLLIHKRSVFGAANAARLMHRWYADEIAGGGLRSIAEAALREPVQQGLDNGYLHTYRSMFEELASVGMSFDGPTEPHRIPGAFSGAAVTEPVKVSPSRKVSPAPKPHAATAAAEARRSSSTPPTPVRRRASWRWTVVSVALVALSGGIVALAAGWHPTELIGMMHHLTQPAAPSRFGYVDVTVRGIEPVVIFIDGKRVGLTPVHGYRLRLGKHWLKMVEAHGPKKHRARAVRDIEITPANTHDAPLRVVISF